MFENIYLWYAVFLLLAAGFAFIVFRENDRKLYILYFVFGSLFGFYFDTISFSAGYYSYPPYYLTLFGLPVSMTLAEGFSVAIAMKAAEALKKRIGFFLR